LLRKRKTTLTQYLYGITVEKLNHRIEALV